MNKCPNEVGDRTGVHVVLFFFFCFVVFFFKKFPLFISFFVSQRYHHAKWCMLYPWMATFIRFSIAPWVSRRTTSASYRMFAPHSRGHIFTGGRIPSRGTNHCLCGRSTCGGCVFSWQRMSTREEPDGNHPVVWT